MAVVITDWYSLQQISMACSYAMRIEPGLLNNVSNLAKLEDGLELSQSAVLYGAF